MTKRLEDLELFAWVGEDEFGSGDIGLKQGLVPAGCIPLVAIVREKIERPWSQAEQQAATYGKQIYLARFVFAQVLRSTAAGNPLPFTCPRCNLTSHNPSDAANRYCGACKKFVDYDYHGAVEGLVAHIRDVHGRSGETDSAILRWATLAETEYKKLLQQVAGATGD